MGWQTVGSLVVSVGTGSAIVNTGTATQPVLAVSVINDTQHGNRGGAALHPAFTAGVAGFAPASGGGTANFLRADGTFAVPPGTGLPDPGSNGIVARTGAGPTDVARTIVPGAGGSIAVTDGSGVAGNPTITRGALTGDVSAPADSNVTTIGANTVSNTQLSDMAQGLIKGRASGAGTGDPTDLTQAQARAILQDMPDPGGNGLVVRTALATDVARSIAVGAGASLTVTNADGTAGNPTLTRAALTGDVTAAADANATTIAAGAVTYAKMQNVSATSRLLGRVTAGAGVIEELTAAQAQSILGSGRFVGFQVLTSGTTYTPSSGVTSQVVEGVGGGGGGGGSVIGTAANAGMGGGGGSGGYFRKRYAIASPSTGTYAIGAAGVAGANTGAVAGNGGNTTFTDGTTLCTAFGGAGAPAQVAVAATAAISLGGAGGAISTNGQVNEGGNPGGMAFRMNGTTGIAGGSGGESYFGGAGAPRVTQGPGANAIANSGSGGSGAAAIGAVLAVAGGTGGAGIIVVWEFA